MQIVPNLGNIKVTEANLENQLTILKSIFMDPLIIDILFHQTDNNKLPVNVVNHGVFEYMMSKEFARGLLFFFEYYWYPV